MARKLDPAVASLDLALKARTVEAAAELHRKLDGNRIRCLACGHRCLILEGLDGICRVRFNRSGKLYVPRGYVGALQVDPIEKKPFFHAFPGSNALSFGMLGCDLHCGYCFAPGTRVLTSRGHLRIEQLCAAAQGGEAVPQGLEVPTHRGRRRSVLRVFRHAFQGELIRIQPACLPAIETTPDHPFLVFRQAPGFVSARDLKTDDLLLVPREFEFSEAVSLKTATYFAPLATSFTVRHRIGRDQLQDILQRTVAGQTSRQIAQGLGLDASHVRHLRSKVRRGEWDLDTLEEKQARIISGGGRGVPEEILVDASFARLLGLFCAEGGVSRSASRRHSATLVFSFGRHERELAAETQELIRVTLGLEARYVERATTLAVEVRKASAALLFEGLCATGSRVKRVPELLFGAHRPIVEAFLEGYVDGDGYRAKNGSITVSTVSADLAAGIAGLVLKLGLMPQWYGYAQSVERQILGRQVRQAPRVHVVRWNPGRRHPSNVAQVPGYYLLPIRDIGSREYDGPVYNLEVADDHTYLANGVAVHNCQNWLTSQALRDNSALTAPQDVEPHELVSLALRHRAPVMVSTYNEPLITSEWAAEVFGQARRRGITCGFVSNGNATPEVLDYLRPRVDLYKVDLKGFRDAGYRSLGGKLQNILDSIVRLQQMGFWLEVVTLVVPGFNDSEDELRDIARFLADVSPDVPWHVTAFHQDYKMTAPENTNVRHLLRAAEIGREAGLRHVYAGNLPGLVGDWENTRCPDCRELLIERRGFRILRDRLSPSGICPACGTTIAGFWNRQSAT